MDQIIITLKEYLIFKNFSEILNGLEIIPVKSIEKVLEVALSEPLTPVTESVKEDSKITETESHEVSILTQKELPVSPRTYDA